MFDNFNTKALLVITPFFLCIFAFAYMMNIQNNEFKLKMAAAGLEECKTSFYERDIIWVKSCSEYIKSRN